MNCVELSFLRGDYAFLHLFVGDVNEGDGCQDDGDQMSFATKYCENEPSGCRW